MSELTDRVRRMLSQAQVFVRDTPFEAVTRARQTIEFIDAALGRCTPEEREELEGLRQLATTRRGKYEAALSAWLEKAEERHQMYLDKERAHIVQPLRARGD